MTVPVICRMTRHEDGSYTVDKSASVYADVSADQLAELLRREYERQQREADE